jgi:hypothetical protein
MESFPLDAGFEVILTRWHCRCLPDAMPAAKGSQRRIRQCRATGSELFMDSHEIPLAGGEKLEDLLAVWLGLLRPVNLRHLAGVRAQHLAHRQS